MRVFITGATGVLGRQFCPLAADHSQKQIKAGPSSAAPSTNTSGQRKAQVKTGD